MLRKMVSFRRNVFIKDRLETKSVPFFDPIHRNKYKTLVSNVPAKSLTSTSRKVLRYKATSGLVFKLFIKSQVMGLKLSISELMTYPLTVTPYYIASVDGFFAKTSKAQGMNYMNEKEEDAILPCTEVCILFQDGNS